MSPIHRKLENLYTKWQESKSLETHQTDNAEISSWGFGKSPAESTRISKHQYSKLQEKDQLIKLCQGITEQLQKVNTTKAVSFHVLDNTKAIRNMTP